MKINLKKNQESSNKELQKRIKSPRKGTSKKMTLIGNDMICIMMILNQ